MTCGCISSTPPTTNPLPQQKHFRSQQVRLVLHCTEVGGGVDEHEAGAVAQGQLKRQECSPKDTSTALLSGRQQSRLTLTVGFGLMDH